MGDNTNLITVKSVLPKKKDGSSEVAIWDKDDAHPGGEAFVAGDEAVLVAPTAAISGAITAGRIIVTRGEHDPDKLLEDGASNIGDGTPPTTTSESPAGGTPLPDDFPNKDILASNNVTTVEQLKGLSEDEFNKLEGIGDARKEEIAKALRKLK
jgi:hypothetical protein